MFNFDNTKKDILSKKDKSSIGEIDEPIKNLCEKINACKNYFTTSSCSGRITLALDETKKAPGVFLFRSHEKVSFEELKEALVEAARDCEKGLIYFKQEPCLVVVSCRDKERQWELFSYARNNGWKKSGILSLDKKLLVEIMSSERLEFPIIKNGEILVNDEFLRVVLEKSNFNLEKGWEKIGELKKWIKDN